MNGKYWACLFITLSLLAMTASEAPAWYPGKFKEERLARERQRQAQTQAQEDSATPAAGYTEGSTKIAGLNVAVWSPRTASGAVPLIVFSHGYLGCNTQTKFLMRVFASSGYLVLAPNHKDASCGGKSSRLEAKFTKPETWTSSTHADRAEDIKTLLDAMSKSSVYARRIDWSRVGLVGHSLGGYTVLGLAGAWPTWRLTGVRAVVALSPYCQPFVLNNSLRVNVPIQYQGGNLDWGITPSISLPGGAYDKTSSPASFVEFQGANHFSWTDLDPDHQSLISHYALAFLDQYVRDIPSDFSTKQKGVAQLRTK